MPEQQEHPKERPINNTTPNGNVRYGDMDHIGKIVSGEVTAALIIYTDSTGIYFRGVPANRTQAIGMAQHFLMHTTAMITSELIDERDTSDDTPL